MILAACASACIGLGVLDYLTGSLLSLAFFYLIPISIGTIVAGRRAGLYLSIESTTAATVAELLDVGPGDRPVALADGVLLITIFGFIVVLLSAVRDSALAARHSSRRTHEFLASAAHQLRTPLAGIRASTDALLVTGASTQQERLLANLSGESERVGRLLASLLRMARLDQGELYPIQANNIATLCQNELDRLQPRAQGLELRLRLPAAPPESLLFSAEAMQDALANLLDNARRHARTTITLTVSVKNHAVEISVMDDGPGLPDGLVDSAFDRFVSLDGRGGSGLGLPIARAMIEGQGGTLTYEQRSFVIRLPASAGTSAARTVDTPP
jgi:signal transduction histidine kinase